MIFQFGKHSRFDRYEDDFARAENVNLVLHATAVHLADKGGRVDRMDCATLSGNRFSVHARTFVLAAGAIETARLLLVSRDSQPAGIGNSRDLVGRYFMEHPDVAVGYLIPDPELDRSAFRLYQHQRAGEHLTVEAMFRLSDSALRTERLLNAVLRLTTHLPLRHDGGRAIGPGRPEIGALRGCDAGAGEACAAEHPGRTTDPPPLRDLALRAPTGGLWHRRDGRAGADDVLSGETRPTPRSTRRPHDDSRLAADEHGLGLDPADRGDLRRRRP